MKRQTENIEDEREWMEGAIDKDAALNLRGGTRGYITSEGQNAVELQRCMQLMVHISSDRRMAPVFVMVCLTFHSTELLEAFVTYFSVVQAANKAEL